MSSAPAAQLNHTDSTPDPAAVDRYIARRAAINRENSQHSTGPITDAGKQRSSRNALRHGLCARTAVLRSEDPAAYEKHCRRFQDEYQPANATESLLVQELADTAWRLRRIPLLEAGLFDLTSGPHCAPQSVIQSLSTLGLHGARLSRQFQKTLDQLRALQKDRRDTEQKQLRQAAALFVHHQHKQIPWDPAADGFVFSREEIERFAGRLKSQNEARHTIFPQLVQDPAPKSVSMAGTSPTPNPGD